jgi:geranylgeranyl diphosphate synthase type II
VYTPVVDKETKIVKIIGLEHMDEKGLKSYLAEKKACVDEALDSYFTDNNCLFDVMYYSLDSGKRIRPILAIAGYEACGGRDSETILPIACGLELIHTYSLIHDDLPAMDNDDLRRGKPSAHKKFGEATAILSGDGLFAYAFELLTSGNGSCEQKCEIVRSVSEAVGPKGVVFGQVLDMSNEEATPSLLRNIHVNKTAKFIAVSIRCGAIMACASANLAGALYEAGVYLGMLFQYTDDILDITGSSEKLGKTPGKDETSGKVTAPRVYLLEGARYRTERYARLVKNKFRALGDRFGTFIAITDYILRRTY